MKIDSENIEALLLDFLTNQLSQEESQAVQKFLEDHPELDPGKDALVFLPFEEIEFCKKDQLKKTNNDELYTEKNKAKEHLLFLISEDQLQPKDQLQLTILCRQDEKFEHEVEIAKLMRFEQDQNLVFQHKSMLKRRAPGSTFIFWIRISAACLVFGLFFRSILSLNRGHFEKNDDYSNITKLRSQDVLNPNKMLSDSVNSTANASNEVSSSRVSTFYARKNNRFISVEVSENKDSVPMILFDRSEAESHLQGSSSLIKTSSIVQNDSLYAKNEMDTNKINKNRDLVPSEDLYVGLSFFNEQIEIKRNAFSKKQNGSRQFHIRLGKFFFSYSKSLTKSNF